MSLAPCPIKNGEAFKGVQGAEAALPLGEQVDQKRAQRFWYNLLHQKNFGVEAIPKPLRLWKG